MDGRLDKLAKRYTQALESMKDIKSELTDVVIKYLLVNSSDLSKCTQFALSEELSMPQSTIRRLLIELEEEGVLESKEVGQAKPYSVCQLGYAVDRGYISFTKKEVQEILQPKESTASKFTHFVVASGVSDQNADKPCTRYLTPGAELMARTFLSRLMGYLDKDPTIQALDAAFTEEERKELRFMLPEQSLFSKILSGREGGLWPTLQISIQEERPSPQRAKELIQASFREHLESGTEVLEKLAEALEKEGYQGLTGREPTTKAAYMQRGDEYPIDYRFRKEYIYTATFVMRQGMKIGRKLGLSSATLGQIDALCENLDEAAEAEYAGIDEGGPITRAS